MTALVARVAFPIALAVAFALWIKGYASVGDGFSAGALAGLGAVTQYVCLDHERAGRIAGARHAWRLVAIALVLVLALLLGPLAFGLPPVTHVPAPGAHVTRLGVLEVHTAVAFDLGIGVLVYGVLVGTFDRLFPLLRGDEA